MLESGTDTEIKEERFFNRNFPFFKTWKVSKLDTHKKDTSIMKPLINSMKSSEIEQDVMNTHIPNEAT